MPLRFAMCNEFCEGWDFASACRLAADYYNAVQRLYVKRSQNKKSIMAACLREACLSINFAPPKAEVAALMQLANESL